MHIRLTPSGSFDINLTARQAARLMAFFTWRDMGYLEATPAMAEQFQELVASCFPSGVAGIRKALDVFAQEEASVGCNLPAYQRRHVPEVLRALQARFPAKDVVRIPDNVQSIMCCDPLENKKIMRRDHSLILEAWVRSNLLYLERVECPKPHYFGQCPMCGTVYYALCAESGDTNKEVTSWPTGSGRL